MAAKMGVNQNTILKTFTDLQQFGIIENQRGIGYFVSETSKQIIFNQRKKEFYDDILPEFLKQASLIRLTKEDILPFLNTLNQTIS